MKVLYKLTPQESGIVDDAHRDFQTTLKVIGKLHGVPGDGSSFDLAAKVFFTNEPEGVKPNEEVLHADDTQK